MRPGARRATRAALAAAALVTAVACGSGGDQRALGEAGGGSTEDLPDVSTSPACAGGIGWERTDTPGTVEDGAHSTTFDAIAASDAGEVWAAGVEPGSGTIAVHHLDDGTWSSEKVSARGVVAVEDIALGAAQAWIVGWSGSLEHAEPVILRHTDGGWKAVDVPAAEGAALFGVAAISENDVVVVGSRADRAFAARWDGSAWKSADVPSPGKAFSALHAVAARATDDIWAVGTSGDVPSYLNESFPLAVHWDGTRWTETVVPEESEQAVLEDVAAIAEDDVVAVGWATDKRTSRAVEWDGGSWQAADVPRVGELRAVAVRNDEAWAATFSDPAVVLRRTGDRWTATAGPKLRAGANGIAGIAASSETIWATAGADAFRLDCPGGA